eukprot:374851-Pyramimonas_sp.AAC.1
MRHRDQARSFILLPLSNNPLAFHAATDRGFLGRKKGKLRRSGRPENELCLARLARAQGRGDALREPPSPGRGVLTCRRRRAVTGSTGPSPYPPARDSDRTRRVLWGGSLGDVIELRRVPR